MKARYSLCWTKSSAEAATPATSGPVHRSLARRWIDEKALFALLDEKLW